MSNNLARHFKRGKQQLFEEEEEEEDCKGAHTADRVRISQRPSVRHLKQPNAPYKMAAPAFPTPKVIGTKRPEVSYEERSAARVVAFNAAGKVAIVYAKRDGYYKLPGGGIDPGEQHEEAAMREMQEETGGLIKIRSNLGCVATTEEYRNHLHQMSYCYVADVWDDSGSPNLTTEEISHGLGHLWMSVDEAKSKMAQAEPRSELGLYIKERDIYLLEEATRRAEEGGV